MKNAKIYTLTVTLLGLRIFAQDGSRRGEIEFKTKTGKKHKALFKSPEIFENLAGLKKGSRVFLEVQTQKAQPIWVNTLTLP